MCHRVWETLERRNEFFGKLRALIEEYPELKGSVDKTWKPEEGQEFEFQQSEDKDAERGYPRYEFGQPAMISGVVVLLNVTTLDGYEDLLVMDPYEQSQVLTSGLIHEAETQPWRRVT